MSRTHPATFTPIIERTIVAMLGDRTGVLLDPFAGEGGSLEEFEAAGLRTAVGLELEAPWAAQDPRVVQGDAQRMPFDDATFDFVVWSPVYGNRFSDHHTPANGEAADARRGYTFDIRRLVDDPTYQLAEDNAGRHAFGSLPYEYIHRAAYREIERVAKPTAAAIVNVKNFIRRGEEVNVVKWHVTELEHLGWEVTEDVRWVPTPSMRRGKNGGARVSGEWIIEFRRAR